MTETLYQRSFDLDALTPRTFDEATLSVRVVAVTESPVRIFDAACGRTLEEVLLIEGMELPPKGSVPLLDSHNHTSVNNVLGSARRFISRDNVLECDVFFSATEAGRTTAMNVKDGHLTDFSVGYLPLDAVYIPEGERRTVGGREYAGPLKITSRWHLRELSVTPIGADQRATARSQPLSPSPTAEPERPAMDSRDTPGTGEISAAKPEISAVSETPPAPPETDRTEAGETAAVPGEPPADEKPAGTETVRTEAGETAAVPGEPLADEKPAGTETVRTKAGTSPAPAGDPPPGQQPGDSAEDPAGDPDEEAQSLFAATSTLDKIFYAFFALMLLTILAGLIL